MFRIRRAGAADPPRILVAHAAAIRGTCRSHYAPGDIEAWAGRLSEGGYADDLERHDTLVAEDDGRVVGFGVLDAARGEVRAVYVHPEMGRRGVGRALLDGLEAIARLRGAGDARLDSSLNAVEFYRAAGWRRLRDARRTFPGGHDIACVAMAKRLPALRLEVRAETPADVAAIDDVERAAFERDGESALVEGLRRQGALAVSVVATLDGTVVGHAALSPVAIDGVSPVVGLGPIAVRPALQRCAIGGRLVEEGLARARERGAVAAVVLGRPGYYPRFGFVPAGRFGLSYPGPISGHAFMAAELVAGALARASGTVRYHAAFDAV